MSGLDTVELVLRDFSTWLRRLFLASLSRNDSASEGVDSFVFPSEPLSLARHLRHEKKPPERRINRQRVCYNYNTRPVQTTGPT